MSRITDKEIARQARDLAGTYTPHTMAGAIGCGYERLLRVARENGIALHTKDALAKMRANSRPHAQPDPGELAERIRELAGTMPIDMIARELHIGRRTIRLIAAENGVEIRSLARTRDWATPSTRKESARAVRQCSEAKWHEFMLFGPVRHYIGWQHPVSVAHLVGIVRHPHA